MNKIIISFFVSAILIGCKYKGLPPLNQTFSHTDINPFGTYVSKQLLTQSFQKAIVTEVKYLRGIEDFNQSLYFSVSQKFNLIDFQLKALKDFVKKGNVAFISAYKIDSQILRLSDSNINLNVLDTYRNVGFINTSVSLQDVNKGIVKYNYFFSQFDKSFTQVTNKTGIKGFNDFNEPNFIVLNYGKGKLILHSDPRAFSNYFLLTNNNYKYLEGVVNTFELDPRYILWGTESKSMVNSGKDSAWDQMMKEPSLSHAIWIV
ncbi:MAG: DUF4350 domain-containing protein, partial [Ferruginibacter sp.]